MGKIVGAIIVVVVLLGVYFWSSARKPAVTPVPQNQTVTQPGTTGATSAAREIQISGNEFAFSPATLILTRGETVKITFTNTGKYPHNFSVTDLGIATKTVNPGESDSVQFTPDKTGTFTYVCTVPTHADKGMKGTMTVQ